MKSAYVLAGETESYGAGGYDAWCVRLDATGGVVWQKAYGGSGNDKATSIQQTSTGAFIMAGRSDSWGSGMTDVWCVKLGSNGNVVWQKRYGGASYDAASAVIQTADRGFMIAGQSCSFSAYGEPDLVPQVAGRRWPRLVTHSASPSQRVTTQVV